MDFHTFLIDDGCDSVNCKVVKNAVGRQGKCNCLRRITDPAELAYVERKLWEERFPKEKVIIVAD